MVERVQQAINDALFGPGAPMMAGVSEAARAALGAMRVPTMEMAQRGMREMYDRGLSGIDYSAAHHTFNVMIDAALSPDGEGG